MSLVQEGTEGRLVGSRAYEIPVFKKAEKMEHVDRQASREARSGGETLPTREQLEGPRVVYTSETPWVNESEHVLTMACSDPRFREATEEFIRVHFRLRRFDQLILPGGPASILISASSFFAIRPQVKMLHETHDFKRILAIAHHDCVYYRLKYSKLDEAARRERQIADLREFSKEVAKLAPGATVELYYAEPASGYIQYLAIESATTR
jgi:hypothetical protein